MSLSENKQKAIAALLTCKTKEQAAEKAGISSRTLRTYFEDPAFLQAYRNAFGSLIDEATRHAQQTISPALDTLSEIMQDADISHAARVSAARAALEFTLRLIEVNDIVPRLEALENDQGD